MNKVPALIGSQSWERDPTAHTGFQGTVGVSAKCLRRMKPSKGDQEMACYPGQGPGERSLGQWHLSTALKEMKEDTIQAFEIIFQAKEPINIALANFPVREAYYFKRQYVFKDLTVFWGIFVHWMHL